MSELDLSSRDYRAPRKIAARLVVTGRLQLMTPAQLGNGDAESITDMPLLLDTVEDQPRPLLSGTSIAGALRGYLIARARGHRAAEELGRESMADRLFGGVKGDDAGAQSPLIVDNALGELPANVLIELRDGVKIDYATHTAQDKFKYDLELLPAGTGFALRLELLLPPEPEHARPLRQALALALSGLSPGADGYGEIALGARRSRGFGRCRVESWQFAEYALTEVEGLLAWIVIDHDGWAPGPTRVWSGGPAAALGAGETAMLPEDYRRSFVISGRFALEGPLLVRSTQPLFTADEQPAGNGELQLPDVVQLRSHRPGRASPGGAAVLPGTSLAGALRSRATMILNTIAAGDPRGQALIDEIFGLDMHRQRQGEEPQPTGSRLIVEERPLDSGQLLVQNRVAIDRFTGGAFDTALFSEAPWFGGAVELRLELRHDSLPQQAELAAAQASREQARVGLLLLLLKDLWSGDLPLGGGASVGRGRLRGLEASLRASAEREWQLGASGEGLTIEGESAAELERYIEALHTHIGAA